MSVGTGDIDIASAPGESTGIRAKRSGFDKRLQITLPRAGSRAVLSRRHAREAVGIEREAARAGEHGTESGSRTTPHGRWRSCGESSGSERPSYRDGRGA
jgi:hypothetical protein